MSQLDKTFYEKIKEFTLDLQLVNRDFNECRDDYTIQDTLFTLNRLEQILFENKNKNKIKKANYFHTSSYKKDDEKR